MKNYFYDGDISYENVNKLIEFMNENEDVRVYLSSTGGDVYAGDVLLEIINENCSELVAAGDIGSYAFEIFFKAKCKKRILKEAFGTYHAARIGTEITSFKKIPKEYDDLSVKVMQKQSKKEIDFCMSIGMTKQEINKIKQSKDVHLTYKRLQELLEFSQLNT